MNTVMYLKRLKDFIPKVALKALKRYLSKADQRHVRLSISNINLINNGICDRGLIKYVVSIGDTLYQIVAIEDYNMNDKKISVVVDHFQLCGARRYAKKFSMKLENFTDDFALNSLEEYLSEFDSNRTRLTLGIFNRICNGIFDSNMIKYVVSTGYGLYQIVAIEEYPNSIIVVVKYSQI